MIEIISLEVGSCQICGRKYNDSLKPFILSCGNTVCVNCKNKLIVKNILCYFSSEKEDKKHSHFKDNPPINHKFNDMLSLINKLSQRNKLAYINKQISFSEGSKIYQWTLENAKGKDERLKKIKNSLKSKSKNVKLDPNELDGIIKESDKIEIEKLIKKNVNDKIKYNLIFEADQNNYNSKEFHELSDNLNNTLIIIRTQNGNIFGGYTDLKWKEEKKSSMLIANEGNVIFEYKKKLGESKTFCFTLEPFQSFTYTQKDRWAILCKNNCGPSFYGMFTTSENNINSSITYPKNLLGLNSDFKINKGNEYFKIGLLRVYEIS